MRFVPATKNFDVSRLPDDLSKQIYRIGTSKNAQSLFTNSTEWFTNQALGPYIQRYFVNGISKELKRKHRLNIDSSGNQSGSDKNAYQKHQYLAFFTSSFFILLIIVVPFLIGIYYSFTDSNGLRSSFIGWKTLRSLFKTPPFCRVFG